jgi:hypothetical protein
VEAVDGVGDAKLGLEEGVDLLRVGEVGLAGDDVFGALGRLGLDDVAQNEADIGRLRVGEELAGKLGRSARVLQTGNNWRHCVRLREESARGSPSRSRSAAGIRARKHRTSSIVTARSGVRDNASPLRAEASADGFDTHDATEPAAGAGDEDGVWVRAVGGHCVNVCSGGWKVCERARGLLLRGWNA